MSIQSLYQRPDHQFQPEIEKKYLTELVFEGQRDKNNSRTTKSAGIKETKKISIMGEKSCLR